MRRDDDYVCDGCGKVEPPRMVDIGNRGMQPVAPVGWYAMQIRHARRERDKPIRRNSDACSVDCAKKIVEAA